MSFEGEQQKIGHTGNEL